MPPVGMQASMKKLHHFARAFREHEPATLALACKRLRPLSPAFGLKSFIRPESGPRKPESSEYQNKEFAQAEAPVGGTRWNPTPEQIGILEMLYGGGMRTPNAPQIEQITAQLAKYGKIEGKNVFYWFQNHKARERQKKKRSTLHPPITLPSPGEESDCSSQKRKSRSWCEEVDYKNREEEEEEEEEEEGGGGGDRTLQLFPLHPELRKD